VAFDRTQWQASASSAPSAQVTRSSSTTGSGRRGASRVLRGVVHFDVSRSLTDANASIATEVFASREAANRQNAEREVAALLDLINAGALIGDYEWTVWEVSAPES
jgi:hypothetical protein